MYLWFLIPGGVLALVVIFYVIRLAFRILVPLVIRVYLAYTNAKIVDIDKEAKEYFKLRDKNE